MALLSYIIGAFTLASGLFAPASALAAVGTSFGGRISTVTLCGGGIQLTLVPAGVFSPVYFFSIGSIPIGPQSIAFHPGQYILGVADLPSPGLVGGCVGQRIQFEGTSI